jgi:thymidylate kinase
MIIILEGHEKSGKTTLAKLLCKNLTAISGYPAIYFKSEHCNIEHSDNREKTYHEVHTLLQFERLNHDKYFIIDRSIMTEYVYSLSYNRNIDVESLKVLAKEFNDENTLLIKLECKDKEELKKRFVEEKDVSFEKNEEIIKLYNKANKILKFENYLELDSSKNRYFSLLEIINYLNIDTRSVR